MFKIFFHKLAHLLKVNKGRPDAFWKDGKLMMSFLCNCGERFGVHDCEDGFAKISKDLSRRTKERKK